MKAHPGETLQERALREIAAIDVENVQVKSGVIDDEIARVDEALGGSEADEIAPLDCLAPAAPDRKFRAGGDGGTRTFGHAPRGERAEAGDEEADDHAAETAAGDEAVGPDQLDDFEQPLVEHAGEFVEHRLCAHEARALVVVAGELKPERAVGDDKNRVGGGEEK